eukprot:scaffold5926_cov51-Isochrysis_galbana.AAC.1
MRVVEGGLNVSAGAGARGRVSVRAGCVAGELRAKAGVRGGRGRLAGGRGGSLFLDRGRGGGASLF